jgi:hypothetical protein
MMRRTNVFKVLWLSGTIFSRAIVFSMVPSTTDAWSPPPSPMDSRQKHLHASLMDGFTTGLSVGSSNKDNNTSRRAWLQSSFRTMAFGGAMSFQPSAGYSLDMDAFASRQLNDTAGADKQSSVALSDDAALCKYGQPSQRKGDACVRAGLPTAATKKGGVDAYGQIDR